MRPFLDTSAEDFDAWLAEQSSASYRARQIRHWLFHRRAATFAEMSDLPAELRTKLAEEFSLWSTKIHTHRTSPDGTEKLLLELHDGHNIECVLLRAPDGRRTACISTQVGCAMGCVFCASGLDGVARNLSTGEIVEELLQLNRLLGPEERLSHIVVMGMGEPLANLDALLPALEIATTPEGLGMSVRHVTISTVGLPKGIRRLAELRKGYHLAVSLHAPNDELRNQLVPVNKNIGLAAILEAADDYFEQTGRRVMYEYVLLGHVNDSAEHAQELAALLAGRNALINVIPYNPVGGLGYRTPRPEATARFVEILESAGIAIKIRHRKGDRIDAACGQLRRLSAIGDQHSTVNA